LNTDHIKIALKYFIYLISSLPIELIKLCRIRFILVDEGALGHYFGDVTALLYEKSKSKKKYFYVIPKKSENLEYLNQIYSKNLILLNSKALKFLTTFFRQYPNLIEHAARYNNYVHDYKLFSVKKEFLPPSKLIYDRVQYKKFLLNIFNIHREELINFKRKNRLKKYAVLHFRKLSLLDQSKFRTTNLEMCNWILGYLSKNIKVVNISINNFHYDNVINAGENHFTKETILAIVGANFYIGDASGPSVVSNLFFKKCFLINFFPLNFVCNHKKSIIIYKKIIRNIEGLDINSFHMDSHFKDHNVVISEPDIEEVMAQLKLFLKL